MPHSISSFILQAILAAWQFHGAHAQVNDSPTSACPSAGGAHLIVGRGSLGQIPYGAALPSVIDSILSQIPGSNADDIIGFPNTLADYQNSETAGAIIARASINTYVKNCPSLPLVLIGYSQGAQVVEDALIGQQVSGFDDNSTINQPLSSTVLARVAAVVLMGDPTFDTSESFHVGNATKNGDFVRRNVENWAIDNLQSRARTYCDAGDLFCAGGTSLAVHGSYVTTYGTAAADFVVQQVALWYKARGGAGNGTVSTAPTATATGSRSKICPAATSSGRPRATSSANLSSTASPTSSPQPYSGLASISNPSSVTIMLGLVMCLLSSFC